MNCMFYLISLSCGCVCFCVCVPPPCRGRVQCTRLQTPAVIVVCTPVKYYCSPHRKPASLRCFVLLEGKHPHNQQLRPIHTLFTTQTENFQIADIIFPCIQ